MGETIRLTAGDGHEFSAYRADPEGTPKAGLVLIQEIFGVNAHIREVVDEYAAAGYAVIAPAVFDRVEPGIELGYGEEDRQTGIGCVGKTTREDNLKDVSAAVAALESAGKTGIIGYCFGGTMAWLGAATGEFDASVCYYGGGIADAIDKQPTCPVMMHFGADDQAIPMEKVDAIRAAHPDTIIHVYEGAGHGFICDHRPSYNEAATNLARERTLEFFAQHLG